MSADIILSFDNAQSVILVLEGQQADLVLEGAAQAQLVLVTESVAGPAGAAGPGLPTGGATGQVATKQSNADYDLIWTTPSGVGGGGVSDGDKGDIVVSSGGTVYTIDPAILSAYGRSLIVGADAVTVRAVLGLGSAATQAGGAFDAAGAAAAVTATLTPLIAAKADRQIYFQSARPAPVGPWHWFQTDGGVNVLDYIINDGGP